MTANLKGPLHKPRSHRRGHTADKQTSKAKALNTTTRRFNPKRSRLEWCLAASSQDAPADAAPESIPSWHEDMEIPWHLDRPSESAPYAPAAGFSGVDAAHAHDRDDPCNLYVGYIPKTINSAQLRAMFEHIGPVAECEVIGERSAAGHKGFGFVRMMTEWAAQEAIHRLHDYMLEGRRLVPQQHIQVQTQQPLLHMARGGMAPMATILSTPMRAMERIRMHQQHLIRGWRRLLCTLRPHLAHLVKRMLTGLLALKRMA
ncbi:hypothetical protein WJX72_000730 [[Myrmecia] bisecta]|uniref:RRM domain-containing protein n=1 Tax=[Myrmecia] bisecta TaxID=41462 RepID=A0AAW1QP07_9CHLO